MTYLDTSASIVIAFICYLVAEFLKNKTKVRRKDIPKAMGFLGIFLSFIGYYFIEGYPATSVAETITYGLASGLAATGFYEFGRALSGKDLDNMDFDDEDESCDDEGGKIYGSSVHGKIYKNAHIINNGEMN